MISVIVPVYNVENYIKECLDSILSQSFQSFELILVDDGSTDGSGRICDEYKEKDSRIRVFHKENRGLSSARNKGIDEAKGEYLCFVDSDDTIRDDYLNTLYNVITADNADLAMCDIEDTRLTKADQRSKHSSQMTSIDAKKWLYDDRTREYVLMVVAWNKLYSSYIFKEIRYPDGRLHEDEFIIGQILDKSTKITFVPEKLYCYRDNVSGITSKVRKMDIRHLDGIDALTERIALALYDEDKELACFTLKNALYKCARLYGEALRVNSIEMIRASMNKYIMTYSRYRDLLSLKQRAKYRLFFFFPRFFNKLYNP